MEKKCIPISEDYTMKWAKQFALSHAIAKKCVIKLIEEVFLRHGFLRRVISDNIP